MYPAVNDMISLNKVKTANVLANNGLFTISNEQTQNSVATMHYICVLDKCKCNIDSPLCNRASVTSVSFFSGSML